MKSRHIIAALALWSIAAPAGAQTRPVYGPVEPKPFTYPDRFTVEPNETIEQAQAKVEKDRRCAKRWALIGAVGGGALDIVTTQINQNDGYRESNPIYGKRATVPEMVLVRGLSGAFSYWRLTGAARRDPKGACRAAKIYTGVSFLPGVINAAVRIRF